MRENTVDMVPAPAKSPILQEQPSSTPTLSTIAGYVLLGVLIILVTGTLFLSRLPQKERDRLYDPVGVYSIAPPFNDLYSVLAGLDCARSGIPATQVCPESGYYFNYPKTFYLLLPTRLSTRDTLPMAVLVLVGFVASMFAFFRSLTWTHLAYTSILLCAPPTLLALERCNVDLVVVSLIAFAVICIEARRRSGLAITAITIAALMKIYPVVGFISAVGRVRRSYLLAGVFTAVMGLELQLDHLRFISKVMLQKVLFSWGYPLAFMRLRISLEPLGLGWLLPEGSEHVLQIAAPALCVFLAIRIIRSGSPPLLEMEHLPGMMAGASLYCFCWLAGANYEYRYIVLLLVLPFLFSSPPKPLRIYAMIALGAIPPMFWLTLNYGSHLIPKLIQEALGLAVFCCLLTVLLVFVFQTVQRLQRSEPAARKPERQRSKRHSQLRRRPLAQ